VTFSNSGWTSFRGEGQLILNDDWLAELVVLVNEELDSAHSTHRERVDSIEGELNETRVRLTKLYDALETGKLALDDLAPRIKELKTRADELSKARAIVEAELIVKGAQH